jgi:hypothetical protein
VWGDVRKFFFAISIILFAGSVQAAEDATKFGSFVGPLDLRMNSDGRTAVLLAPFGYVDPVGKKWETPTGWTVERNGKRPLAGR